MNLNDNAEELREEEQAILDKLILKMDQAVNELDNRMQEYVDEAKNVDISLNLDLYLSKLMSKKKIKDTAENRKRILQNRDELYKNRLLLKLDDDERNRHKVVEYKVGLHSCIINAEWLVIDWKLPLCRHYLLDNSSVEYVNYVKDKFGRETRTKYKLLVKNQVDLRFTHVIKATNMYPGILDKKLLEIIQSTGFFTESYIEKKISEFDPDKYNPDEAAEIIADEFLQELLERRSTPEFKNIVFSIQKKQGEIIQAPYNRDMIVQGCAGSGKSMIMLHRIPILLFDYADSLSRTSLYIITPSTMYIQLAEKMMEQLEISDIKMGTIEQYYDWCIGKYAGHKAGEYGRISYSRKINAENEAYVYSDSLIYDINRFYESIIADTEVPIDKAYEFFGLERSFRGGKTFSQVMSNRSLDLQDLLNVNNNALSKYFKAIKETISSLQGLSFTLSNRKNAVLREYTKIITRFEEEVIKAQRELDKLDKKENAIAIKNRNSIIETNRQNIVKYSKEKKLIDEDNEYFDSLIEISKEIDTFINSFVVLKNEFSENTVADIYTAIDNREKISEYYDAIYKKIQVIDDKYLFYVTAISKDADRVRKNTEILNAITENYLEYKYYSVIKNAQEKLSRASTNSARLAYESVMEKIGVKRNENGTFRALRCSPYIYLQALYLFRGAPNNSKDSLLAIDEAQGIAPEEIRLLKAINDNKVVLNMYGDINQHIEGTKGIDRWDEFKDIVDYDLYEMNENYRNASQITEYCNKTFGMKMNAINTPGKGVHILQDKDAFYSEMINQLVGENRVGLSAILVGDDAEARYLLGEFADYIQKFHDMTDEEFDIHHTRWNIINIDEAKGLEFSNVIVLAGRMSRNQKYIACTRALDDLYVYEGVLDISKYEKKVKNIIDNVIEDKEKVDTVSAKTDSSVKRKDKKNNATKNMANHKQSLVKLYFEDRGFEVIDNRENGGRLWILGDKSVLKPAINEAISKFNISGKYTSGKESGFREGWCTKTDK